MHSLRQMHHPIESKKEVSPTQRLLFIPAQMHVRIFAPAYKKLLNSLFRSKLLERLLRIDDRQRHENPARPRRDLIDIEVAPVWKENDLRRNRRYRVIVILP